MQWSNGAELWVGLGLHPHPEADCICSRLELDYMPELIKDASAVSCFFNASSSGRQERENQPCCPANTLRTALTASRRKECGVATASTLSTYGCTVIPRRSNVQTSLCLPVGSFPYCNDIVSLQHTDVHTKVLRRIK